MEVAKFRQIWSHWEATYLQILELFLSVKIITPF